MSSEIAGSVPVWCHSCGLQSNAATNLESELECLTCRSTFVEETGQGIDMFVNNERVQQHDNEHYPSGSVPAAFTEGVSGQLRARDDHSTIIHQILDNLFGIPSIISGPASSTSTDNPRLRVRPAAPHMLQTGMFDLLHSVASIRYDAQGGFESHGGALDNAGFEQFLHHILMNESSHAGAPPATEEMLAGLQREQVVAGSDMEKLGGCCISQEAFEIDDVMVTLPCGHKYKEEPIIHWLKMHRTCPVCRINITQSS